MTFYQQSNAPLVDLWQQYSAYKLWGGKGSAESYRTIESKLKRLDDNSTPQTTINGLLKGTGIYTFLATFSELHSCCKWAKETGLVKVNPLEWLHLQIAPINRDKLNLIKFKPRLIAESITWDELLPKPAGQEIAKKRITKNNFAIDGGYVNAQVQDLWFKFGEPPVLLMTAPHGYWAIRKTVTNLPEVVNPVVRRVLFNQDYLAAKGVPLLHLHATGRCQVTLPLSTLQVLSSSHV